MNWRPVGMQAPTHAVWERERERESEMKREGDCDSRGWEGEMPVPTIGSDNLSVKITTDKNS